MAVYIALLRGINVGGSNKLPMKELSSALKAAGYENIKTYIQSGNVVFQSNSSDTSAIAEHLSNIIEDGFDFRPSSLVYSYEDYRNIIEATPFDVPEDAHHTLHINFLAEEATSADIEKIENLKTATEKYRLTNKAFYLHAPDGIGRSKLAANVEKSLGVSITARNMRSALKILAMAKEL